MISMQIIFFILFVVTFASLWIFYFWFYRQYYVDKTRQKLFKLRDELFDFAANDNISFEHQSYIILRTTINGMIQYTHRVDLIVLIILWYVHRSAPMKRSFTVVFNEASSNLPRDLKLKMQGFCDRMNCIIVGHIIGVSIHVLPIAVIILALKRGMKNLKHVVTPDFPGIPNIDTEAAAIGGFTNQLKKVKKLHQCNAN